MAAFCAQCGAQRAERAVFCAKCGSQAQTDGQVEPAAAGPATPTLVSTPTPATGPPSLPEPAGGDQAVGLGPAPTTLPAAAVRSPQHRGLVALLCVALVAAATTGVLLGRHSAKSATPSTTTSTTASTTTSPTSTTLPGDPAGLINALKTQGPALHVETIPTPQAYFAMVVMESDNSGDQYGSGALRVWKLEPTGWAEQSKLDTSGPIYDWRVADFTGDGVNDFLVIWTPGSHFGENLATAAACNNTCWQWAQFASYDQDKGETVTTDELGGDLVPTGGGPLGNVTLQVNTCDPNCADGRSEYVSSQWSATNKRFEE